MEKINRINNPRVTKEYSDNIPIQEARKSLLRSGYLLEARLENILLKNDYYVQSNYVYPDPESNKPREIDLDAILAIDIKPRKLEYIFLELIIECINNNQPLAFITKEPPFRDYQSFEIKMLGRPETISKTRNSKILLSIPEYLKMKDYHHYFKGSVATQYCTFDLKQKGPNKGEWRAYHHDDHHESLVKLCQALEYSKLDFEEEFDYRIDNSLNIQFFYPLLVVQNDILDVRQIEKKIIINKTNHIKFNVKDFVKGEEIGYIIDVIKEDFFPDYLKIVKKEMDETAQLLNKKYPTIHHELQKQARKAKIGKTIKIISSLMGKQLINVEKT